MAIMQPTPNVPVEIALKFPDGKSVEGRFGDQTMYSLSTPPDHVLYLDNDVAARLNILEPRKGEVIMACKRWTGAKKDKPVWDFWRPEADQQQRRSGAGASPPTPVAAGDSQRPDDDYTRPNGSSNGGSNGSNGHANGYSNGNGHGLNGRAINPELPVPPSKIPMNVAVIEAVRMVQDAMKASGEQWSDQSRQGLVSTIIIQAGKEGWLTIWERGGVR